MAITEDDLALLWLKHGADYPYDQRGARRPRKAKDWAEAAARGVLANLCDRSRIKWELASPEIPNDVRREIVASLARIIRLAALGFGDRQIVPVEPTEQMIAAGWIDKEDVDPDDIYRAMLAAAPEATR